MTEQSRLLQFSSLPGSSLPSSHRSTYQLLSLPPSLLSLLTSSASTSTPLEIRGDASDSATLVTPSETYVLRGVQNSNSLCICSSGHDGGSRGKWFNTLGVVTQEEDEMNEEEDAEEAEEERPRKRIKGDIEIESVLHETLEAVIGVPRTDKLVSLLKGCDYTGETNEIDHPPSKSVSFDDLRSRLPASDSEIRRALTKARVVNLDSSLRSIPSSYLGLQLLPSLLSSLPLPALLAHPPNLTTKQKKPKSTKPAEPVKKLVSEADESDILDALDSVDCGKLVGLSILSWFGNATNPSTGKEGGEAGSGGGKWNFELELIVLEIGIGLLAQGGFGPQPIEPFLHEWKQLCRGFSPLCQLSLLSGISLSRSTLAIPTIQYLPSSSLSPDPATRFSELFSLQPKWLESELALFVNDLTGGDKKKMDSLVLKFVRKVKQGDTGITWWTPRNLWN